MTEPKIRNMEEFAAASGISRPTVSKYFNDPESVRKSTRERIEAALERFEYRPNFYAMNQNRRSTKNIGVVVANLADPFFAEISRNIESLIISAGFRPILVSSHGSPDEESAALDNLRSIKPAGVLLAPLGRTSHSEAIRDFCSEVSTVLIDSDISGAGEAFFGSNNDQSIDLIVDYLCRTGEPPAFFEMTNPPNPNAYKRRAAYLASMKRLGHEPQLVQVPGDGWDFEAIGFQEGNRVLAKGELTTNTVLCSNDRLAIGFLSAAYESGHRVGIKPDCTLRVAGHDDHPFSRYTCPSLTTVSQDYRAIADRATRTILSLIETDETRGGRETHLFEGRLVMRGSA